MSKTILLTILIFSLSAFAQKREALLGKDRPIADLVRESQTLTLQKEETVQKPLEPSHSMISLLLGSWQPKKLIITTKSKSTEYNFEKPVTTFTARFDHYPLKFAGRWGFNMGPSYAYLENDTPTRTSLHIIGGSIGLGYRGEYKSNQFLIPYVAYGRTYLAFVQRGTTDPYNTSESGQYDSMTAGIGIHLNRLGILESRNESEILLQYSRTVDSETQNRNLSGNVYQIGGTLTL